jgi:hypothetical protein
MTQKKKNVSCFSLDRVLFTKTYSSFLDVYILDNFSSNERGRGGTTLERLPGKCLPERIVVVIVVVVVVVVVSRLGVKGEDERRQRERRRRSGGGNHRDVTTKAKGGGKQRTTRKESK